MFSQRYAKKIIDYESVLFICGRFEGIDQRVIDYYNIEELSIGDYVISGGDLAAMVVVDCCVRLIPGVLGNCESLNFESFSDSNFQLEYPQYTRPRLWNGLSVPDALLSGNHAEIKKWRQGKSMEITEKVRPDLVKMKKI